MEEFCYQSPQIIGIVFGLVFTFIIGLIIGYLLVKNKRDKGGRSVMGLKERVKDWYLRPRGSAFFGFVAWVLHSRRAFSVLLVMGHIVTVLFFGFFLLLSFLFGWNWFFRLVLFVFFLLTVRNLWKCLKFFRVSGSSVNASMNEMIYGGRLK